MFCASAGKLLRGDHRLEVHHHFAGRERNVALHFELHGLRQLLAGHAGHFDGAHHQRGLAGHGTDHRLRLHAVLVEQLAHRRAEGVRVHDHAVRDGVARRQADAGRR